MSNIYLATKNALYKRADKNINNMPFFELFIAFKKYIKFKRNLHKSKSGIGLDPVEYFLLKDKKVVYVVNSKVACSSIKKNLMMASGVEIDSSLYANIHSESARLGLSTKTLDINPDEYTFFSVVRNPFERIVSLYINKFQDYNKISKIKFEYSDYFGGAIKQDDSFDEFVGKISKIPDVLCERHFKPQAYLLCEQSKKKVDKFFKLEDIDKFNEYLESLNVARLGHENKSKPYDYRDYYNLKTFELVKEKYYKDIVEFNYVEEMEKLEQYLKSKMD